VKALAVALVLIGCGDDAHPSSPDGGPDAHSCPTGSRSYQLAQTGVQAIPGQSMLFQIGTANLATDADVISVHQDFYGLPWDEFEANQPPPAEWDARMSTLLQQASGKPVFLTLQLVGGSSRQYLADKAVVTNGDLSTMQNWSVRCYDFASMADGASKKQAYLRYVDYMVRKFQPRWVNVAVEMNLFMACGSAWPGLVDVANAAYDTVKQIDATIVAFPSIQIDNLYGYSNCPPGMTQQQCFDANYAQLAGLKRDRFAISTYPYLLDGIRDDVPADWFTRGGDRGGERTIVAETGWISTNAVAQLNGTCEPALAGTEMAEQAYLDLLLTQAQAHQMDLVTWWSNRDLLPAQVMTDCPCTFDQTWCAIVAAFRSTGGSDPMAQFFGELVLKVWGTMGIRTWDGTAKPMVFDRWQQALAQPICAP